MTNTADLLLDFVQYLVEVDLNLLEVDESVIAEYLADVAADEVPSFRQTVCKSCGLDVEVDLTDPGMSTRDRGGSASCPDGRGYAHDPALDDADYEAHEWHVGDVAH